MKNQRLMTTAEFDIHNLSLHQDTSGESANPAGEPVSNFIYMFRWLNIGAPLKTRSGCVHNSLCNLCAVAGGAGNAIMAGTATPPQPSTPEKVPAAFLLVMAGADQSKTPPSVGALGGRWVGHQFVGYRHPALHPIATQAGTCTLHTIGRRC